jgi:hypothetical protein
MGESCEDAPKNPAIHYVVRARRRRRRRRSHSLINMSIQ